MSIENAQIAVSADDGQWGAGFFNNGNNVGVGKSGATSIHAFLRFDNLTFNTSINSATLTVIPWTTYTNTVPMRIYGILANDPAAPTDATDADSRTLTTAFVDWTPGNWTDAIAENAPDLTDIFQELLDEGYTYNGTQAVMLYIKDNGAASSTSRAISAVDFSSGSEVATLEINYGAVDTPPTVTQHLPLDAATVTTTTPSFEATGSDAENHDIEYEIQISNQSGFPADGNVLSDNNQSGTAEIHTQVSAVDIVDDRPGQSWTAVGGGRLHSIRIHAGADEADCDGTALIRVFTHQGVFGTSSEPLNPADPGDTPTRGELATSETVAFSGIAATSWITFNFTGVNQINLTPGEHYVFIVDWIPNPPYISTNNMVVNFSSTDVHAGNLYNDGNNVANNGIEPTWDVRFEIYEVVVTLDKLSGTDSGFINTVVPADTNPFTTGQRIRYTVPGANALTDTHTYYWRIRGRDPAGTNTWGAWSATRSFVVDTSAAVPIIAASSKSSNALHVGL